MKARVCNEPGCPTITIAAGGKCDAHRRDGYRQADARRGSTSERGYGTGHQAERDRWTSRVASGTCRCARCGTLIVPGTPWDLGHDDDDRSRYAGPEHSSCNRATKSHFSGR